MNMIQDIHQWNVNVSCTRSLELRTYLYPTGYYMNVTVHRAQTVKVCKVMHVPLCPTDRAPLLHTGTVDPSTRGQKTQNKYKIHIT